MPLKYRNDWLRNKREILLDKLSGRRFTVCGCFHDLEFAHVKPTGLTGMGRGRERRLYDVQHHPDCYTVMYKPCHKQYDAEHGIEYFEFEPGVHRSKSQ